MKTVPAKAAPARPVQYDKTIRLVVDAIRVVRPDWSEWHLKQALLHAVKGGYTGTADRETSMAYAVVMAAKPSVGSPETLKWPEQWRWAASVKQ